MAEVTHEPLLPRGLLRVRTDGLFADNTQITKEMGAAYTEEINTIDELRDRFLKIPALFSKHLKSGSQVVTHLPNGAYSPGALQITAIGKEIVETDPNLHDNTYVATRTIYDFPEDARIEYFRQIINAYKAVQKSFVNYTNDDYLVVYTENAAKVVSNEKHRVGRTIALPHVQVSVIPTQSNEQLEMREHQLLSRERDVIKILQGNVDKYMPEFLEEVKEKTKTVCTYFHRHAPPYGYTIKTGICMRDLDSLKQAGILSEIMTIHHRYYTSKSTELVSQLEKSKYTTMKKKILPQASYRVYGTVDQSGYLEISISESIFAPSGVIEAAGRGIVRDPGNPSFFKSDETGVQYYGEVARHLADQ